MQTHGVEINEQTSYFGYVYMWCDMERDMFYIGSHKGSIFDKYKSGSKWLNDSIKKRPTTFKMLVLNYYCGNDRSELYELETKWLKFYNVESNDAYYNFKNQAKGGMGPFKHKGKKRTDYSPGWIDHRKGKKAEDIYKNPDAFKERLRKQANDYFDKHGHGWKKGIKHSKKDPRKGKTVEEIYGYRNLVNPDKPFVVTIYENNERSPYEIYCLNEREFYEKVKMDYSNLKILKDLGEKIVKRINPSARHDYPIGTILKLKFVEEIAK